MPVSSVGNTGMAPFWVHTYADVHTANLCASSTGIPFSSPETNAAVNESPAPTVSATLTRGVSWNDTRPGVKT